MPDVPVSALQLRHQKLVDNARIALELGNLDYVIDATQQVLKATPGCVTVRRLNRIAQLKKLSARSRLVAKAIGSLSSTPFIFASVKKDPARAFENAEKILSVDPTSVSALRLLAEAAGLLGFPETVAFALGAVQEIEPSDTDNLVMLGEAWLTAGKPVEALRAADKLLKLDPSSTAAQDLMRKAAVAQTNTRGRWDSQGVFRENIDDESGIGAAESIPTANDEEKLTQQLQESLARVQQEADHLPHYRRIVEGYRRLGQLPEALLWTRKARQVAGGRSDPALERHEVELETAELETQVRIAESALLSSGGDAEALARVAAAKSELASYRLFEAKRFSERYPNDFEAKYKLGKLYLEAGQFDAAIAQFQHSQKHPAFRLVSLIGLGRSYKAKQLYDLAVSQFALVKVDLQEMDDNKKDITYQLGECYEQMGRGEQAITEFKSIYSDDILYRDVAAKIDRYYSR